MLKTFAVRAAAGASLLAVTGSALAVDVSAGDWKLSVGGFINAYYTHSSCKGDQTVGGAALATQALGCGGQDSSTVIGNGLLPNALITSASTQQEGWDINATLMIGASTATGSSIANNSDVDVRQGFVTFGNAGAGTFKFGRDYGMFGKNAILSDMTLIGTGATTAATQRSRVTLGHIGAGYTYLGHYGQIGYTTPDLGGFTAAVSLMSPVDASATAIADDQPQVQAQLQYAGGGAKVWGGLKNQKFKDATNGDYTMSGYEIGGTYSIAGFGLLANVQGGKGIGVLSDGDAGDLKQTNVLLQGTYDITPKVKVGLSWGQSKMKDGTGTDLRSNANTTGGVYYKLTKAITMVGELSHTESKSFDGAKAKLDGISLGAILFF